MYLKVTPRNFMRAGLGQGARRRPSSASWSPSSARSGIAWGSNFPASEGTLADLLAPAKRSLACAAASDQEWIFGKTAQTLYPALAD